MSEYAEGHRKANKDKAARLAGGKNEGAVDASGWKNGGEFEPFTAEKKTGKEPVAKRAYKDGGHVKGEEAAHHAGRAKRAHKMGGGPLGGEGAITDPAVAAAAAGATQNRAGVSPNRMNFGGNGGAGLIPSATMGLKRGGKAKRADGGDVDNDANGPDPRPSSAARGRQWDPDDADKGGGASKSTELKKGGRAERKSGGRAGKGKMNVNIIIAQPHGQPDASQQPPAPQQPHLVPPPGPQAPPMGGMPMGGAPMGGGMPPMGPAGGAPRPPMPMPRKDGGRAYPIEHASGGGKGREEKLASYGVKPPRG